MTTSTPIRVENEAGVDLLRAAVACTGGRSLEADWSGYIPLSTPISIASGTFLSITGEDTLAEIHGGSKTRMFKVSPGGRLTLTRLKLSGGSETSGGAIYSESAALILDSCVLHDNVATDGDGGAVRAKGGNVTIRGGEFVSNKAAGYGGAVAATGANTSLVVQGGSIFEGNAALEGGALYCSGLAESGLARFSLSATTFTSNNATAEAEVQRGTGRANVLGELEGVDGGGAVAFLNATADISDSVFSGNHANDTGGAVLGGTGTDMTVNGCTFEGNTAEVFGGAIAAASMTLGGNTQLIRNMATSSGGAVSTTVAVLLYNLILITTAVPGHGARLSWLLCVCVVSNRAILIDTTHNPLRWAMAIDKHASFYIIFVNEWSLPTTIDCGIRVYR